MGKAEVGRVVIDACREQDTIRISVRDDGAGMNLDAVRQRAVAAGLVHPDIAEDLATEQLAAFVFHPGLSTAETVSEISGRGVGMDAVRATLESLGGGVEITTEAGLGTCTTLTVPDHRGGAARPAARSRRRVRRAAHRARRAHRRGHRRDGREQRQRGLRPGRRRAHAGAVAAGATRPRRPGAGRTRRAGHPGADRGARRAGRGAGPTRGRSAADLREAGSRAARSVRALAGLTILGDGRPVFVLEPNHLV